jgi:alginate O-acetyltransferase complex protein AlgI
MLFNSLTFAVFFTCVLASYWSLRSWEARKNLLLVASYVFYGAWNPPFALLLFATTAMDFYLGSRMGSAQSPGARRVWLVISVAVNLSMLGFFKYGNFMLQNLEWVSSSLGGNYKASHLDIILPVGISFYTFHSLSYTLDVYNRVIQPTKSLRDFVLAVSFFPQLVAGPIVRAADFLPQCGAPPSWNRDRFLWGLWLMNLGLFEKVVLADTFLSHSANTVFSATGALASLDAWTGTLAFAGQIFFDFAGYSTCAIGAALCLGFQLKDNFRFPYAAIGFSDFWRRWHISLSTFLRDFLYIPLGGNRAGAGRAAFNLVLVMFLGGLWHGAAWTFVVWGLLHGFYLVVERVLSASFGEQAWVAAPPVQFLLSLLTYVCVCVAWVFFRAQDFGSAALLLRSMFGQGAGGAELLPTRDILQVALVTVLTLGAHWALRNRSLEQLVSGRPTWLLGSSWAVMACFIILSRGISNVFIYFQF